jgi:hypothetical protein
MAPFRIFGHSTNFHWVRIHSDTIDSLYFVEMILYPILKYGVSTLMQLKAVLTFLVCEEAEAGSWLALTGRVNRTPTRGGPLSLCKSPQKSAKNGQKRRILTNFSRPFYGNPCYDQIERQVTGGPTLDEIVMVE